MVNLYLMRCAPTSYSWDWAILRVDAEESRFAFFWLLPSSSSETSCLKALWDLLTLFLSRFNYSFWKLSVTWRRFETQGSSGDEALDPRSLSLFLLSSLAGEQFAPCPEHRRLFWSCSFLSSELLAQKAVSCLIPDVTPYMTLSYL